MSQTLFVIITVFNFALYISITSDVVAIPYLVYLRIGKYRRCRYLRATEFIFV